MTIEDVSAPQLQTHADHLNVGDGLAEWIADAAQPPRGVRLVADDGSEFSGVVLVERNRPVLMLALRVGAASQREPRPQAPYATPYERPLWSPYDEDGPIR